MAEASGPGGCGLGLHHFIRGLAPTAVVCAAMPTLTLPDGNTIEVAGGATALDAARAIGPRLASAAVVAVLDGRPVDLSIPIESDAGFAVVTAASDEGRVVLRHSTAHVLAQAVLALYPGTKFAIGPPVEDGFYYDFEVASPFEPEDLERIEAKMREIIAEDQPFVRSELSKPEGVALFADQPYKAEIIESVEAAEGAADDTVSVYRNSEDFVDLCRGPHVPSTGRLGSFKLMRVAGAYWRGDSERQQLQRIYGTAWESQNALDEHIHRLEEASRRDHRRLGAELDLFSFPEELGSGLAVWHPNGALIRKIMEDYSREEHLGSGYQLVVSPHIARSVLWETSGHLDFYADSMYPPMEYEGSTYYAKPMNCPFHVMVYKSRTRSYREFPLRFFEFGTVYRHEASGVVHGLLRARGFTQDDSHIFCSRGQIVDEIRSLLAFVVRVISTFGFEEFSANLSTRPAEKSIGSDEMWEESTDALRAALESEGLAYGIDEGGGAFYGPKIDIHVKDAIGRQWQLSTLQLDFNLPERFDLEYMGQDNGRHRPYMIHRAMFGSIERFFGILVEHYAGAFPTWLAPIQVKVLPIADRHFDYADEIALRAGALGLRAEVDNSRETLGNKIRRSQGEKVPYMAVVGDRDVSAGTVAMRTRDGEDRRDLIVDDALEMISAESKARERGPGEGSGDKENDQQAGG